MIKMLLKNIHITILLLSTVVADTINVPSDFPTIQGALNVASNGDVLMISEGTLIFNQILSLMVKQLQLLVKLMT